MSDIASAFQLGTEEEQDKKTIDIGSAFDMVGDPTDVNIGIETTKLMDAIEVGDYEPNKSPGLPLWKKALLGEEAGMYFNQLGTGQKFLVGLSKLLEPLYILSLPRAISMQVGGEQPDAVATWFKNLPRAFPGGEKPEEIKSFTDVLLERGAPGWAAAVFGFAGDLITDPSSWISAGVLAGTKAAAKKLIEQGVERSVAKTIAKMSWRDIAAIADEIPDEVLRTQIKAAAQTKRAYELVNPIELARELLPESVRTTLTKHVIGALDNNPITKSRLGRRVYEYIVPRRKIIREGGTVSDQVPPGQALYTEPVYWSVKTAGTPHEKVVKETLGKGDALSPITAKPGAKTEARVIGRHIFNAAYATTAEIQNTFKNIIGYAPDAEPVLYNSVDRILADIVDKLGPGYAADILKNVGGGISTDKVRKFIEEAYPAGNVREKVLKRFGTIENKVKRLAAAYDVPEERIWQFLEHGTKAIWGFHAIAGYYLSGMDIFDRAITKAAAKLLSENSEELAKLGITSVDEAKSLVYNRVINDFLSRKYGMVKPKPGVLEKIRKFGHGYIPPSEGPIPVPPPAFKALPPAKKIAGQLPSGAKEIVPALKKLGLTYEQFLEGAEPLRIAAWLHQKALPAPGYDMTKAMQEVIRNIYGEDVAARYAKLPYEERIKVFQQLVHEYDNKLRNRDKFISSAFKADPVREVNEAADSVGELIDQLIRNVYKTEVEPIASVSFDDYLSSLYDGYLRRVVPFVGRAGASRLDKALEGAPLFYLSKNIAADHVIDAIEKKYGKDVADKLVAHLVARGDGPISIDELATLFNDDLRKVASLMEDLGVAPEDITKFFDAFMKGAPDEIAAMAIGKYKWQERVLPEEKLFAEYLGQLGATRRLEAYGRTAARSITAQEYVSQSYNALRETGLLKETPEGLFAQGGKMVDEWGVEYIKVPNNPDDWGPLAGKFIPRYVADPMLRALDLNDPTMLQEAIQLWRSIALSSPDTVIRNIGSGLVMMAQAGMPLSAMPNYLRKAADALRDVREGKFDKLGPGARGLQVYSEGKLYGEALDDFERNLLDGLGVMVKQPETFFGRLRNIMQNQKYSKVNPLLWFEYSEDLMRMASFLYYRDTLLKAGLSAEKAGEKAAAIANHILFNYAEQPYIFQQLKKRGWLLFPAFTYFNVGRTLNLMARRPLAATLPQHLYEAALTAASGSEEEKRRRERMLMGTYLMDQMTIPIKYGDHYIVIPLSQYIPTAASEPTSLLNEFATGGIAKPAISALYAVLTGENPPWESKYGVYYTPDVPEPTVLERLDKAARTAAVRSVPGLPRRLMQIGQAIYDRSIGTDPEVMLELYGKTGNKTLDEALLNLIVSARLIGPAYAARIQAAKAQRCLRMYTDSLSRVQHLMAMGRSDQAADLERAARERSRRCLEEVRTWQR